MITSTHNSFLTWKVEDWIEFKTNLSIRSCLLEVYLSPQVNIL